MVEACRTPYGRFDGALKGFTAPELGALAIKEVLRRTNGKVKPADIDYVFMGQVVPAGCGQVPSRQATILAGLPESVPSITVNKVCSSGIKTVDLAVQMIQLGRADICIAGGQESMTNAPFSLPEMRWGAKMGLPSRPAVDLMVNDGLWCAFYNRHMALHGSEVADEFGYSRAEQDEWALRSQLSAVEAMKAGRLEDEIFPVEIREGKKTSVLSQDEGPRPETTLEGLAKLPPVFGHKSTVTGQPGSVTAGNAPGVNDGGDVCLLMSAEKAAELGLKPLCTIVDYAEVSQPPKDIATVPGLAIKKILEQNDLTLDKVDLIEINEAFRRRGPRQRAGDSGDDQGGDVRQSQRERQRHRLRTSHRGHGGPDPDDPRLRAPPPRRGPGGLRHLFRRGPGRRHADPGVKPLERRL